MPQQFKKFWVLKKQKCGTQELRHTSLLIIKNPCPSIMYDIIIIRSYSASGNFSGSLVVSISNAQT